MALSTRLGLTFTGAQGDTLPAAQFNQIAKARLGLSAALSSILGGPALYAGGAAALGDISGGTLYPACTLVLLDSSGYPWWHKTATTKAITFNVTSTATGDARLYAVPVLYAYSAPTADAAVGGPTDVAFVADDVANGAPPHSLLLGTGTITASALTAYTATSAPAASAVMHHWNLAADSGTAEQVDDGETLTIVGDGTTCVTTVAATNWLTILAAASAELGPPAVVPASRWARDASGAMWYCTDIEYETWEQKVCGALAGPTDPVNTDFVGDAIPTGYRYYNLTTHTTRYYTGAAWATLPLTLDAGSYAVTLIAASCAADRTYTLPDAGGAASVVLTAGTQTLAGTYIFTNGNRRVVRDAKLGPPTTGAHVAGDQWIDAGLAKWDCTADGTPGTWGQAHDAKLAADPVAGDFNGGAILTGYSYRNTTTHLRSYYDGSAFVETATPAISTAAVNSSKVASDSYNRYSRDAAGAQSWGPGSGAADATLSRTKAGALRLGEGQQFNAGNLNATIETLLVDRLVGLLAAAANLRALWLFNLRSGTAITDRSPVVGTTAHPVTLSEDAANWSPEATGTARHLVNAAAKSWSTPDAADLTFGNGTTDSAFSLLLLCKPSAASYLLAKNSLQVPTQEEWSFNLASGVKPVITLWDNSTGGTIGRKYNTAVSTSVWHTLGATYAGAGVAGLHVWLDGAQVDDTAASAGSYTAMEDKDGAVGGYYIDAGGGVNSPFQGSLALAMIVAEELTSAQMLRMDRLLRSHAGVTF